MRRTREPGTRNPFSCPLSKQRIMVCWLTLQILAASPVVKTVFIRSSTPDLLEASRTLWPPGASLHNTLGPTIIPDSPLYRFQEQRPGPLHSVPHRCASPVVYYAPHL